MLALGTAVPEQSEKGYHSSSMNRMELAKLTQKVLNSKGSSLGKWHTELQYLVLHLRYGTGNDTVALDTNEKQLQASCQCSQRIRKALRHSLQLRRTGTASIVFGDHRNRSPYHIGTT